MTIAIVDTGVEIDHPDLQPNINRELCYDFIDSDLFNEDRDPSPEVKIAQLPANNIPKRLNDGHGTCCAGIATGRGFNNIGILGVAPEATLLGYRLNGWDVKEDGSVGRPKSQGDNDTRALKLHRDKIHIYSNSRDRGKYLEPLYYRIEDELKIATIGKGKDKKNAGRGGLGSIFVFGAGNERKDGNSNYSAYANSRYTIAVAASAEDGTYASYSSPGANLLVNAPGNHIPTTDRMGKEGYNPDGYEHSYEHEYEDQDYTKHFSGTSAITPVVSGVIALMLQANPLLDWRDVQYILLQTAYKNPDEDWQANMNPAGYSHSVTVADRTPL